jgi:hypothetical protein
MTLHFMCFLSGSMSSGPLPNKRWNKKTMQLGLNNVLNYIVRKTYQSHGICEVSRNVTDVLKLEEVIWRRGIMPNSFVMALGWCFLRPAESNLSVLLAHGVDEWMRNIGELVVSACKRKVETSLMSLRLPWEWRRVSEVKVRQLTDYTVPQRVFRHVIFAVRIEENASC